MQKNSEAYQELTYADDLIKASGVTPAEFYKNVKAIENQLGFMAKRRRKIRYMSDSDVGNK